MVAVARPIHARLKREANAEMVFRWATLCSATLVLLLLVGVLISLTYGAWPAIKAFGFNFLTTEVWNPVTEKFGALAPIYGTVVTSIIAMLIAIPIAFGIAVFLTETCPRWLRTPIGIAIELLAAIPSIVFGIWGLFILAPILQLHVQPWLIDHLGPWPIIGALFQGAPYGIGLLTAGLVLAIMVLPFITAVMREVFQITPTAIKEAAYGVGATQWEVVWDVVLAVVAPRRDRRNHARSRARARRDDGRDVRRRQRASNQHVVARAGHDDRRVDRERVRGSGR